MFVVALTPFADLNAVVLTFFVEPGRTWVFLLGEGNILSESLKAFSLIIENMDGRLFAC